MNFETWEETYSPKQNPIDPNASYSGLMFETYGEELGYVSAQDPRNVWTIRDGEGSTVITAGVGLVNRLGYLVTSEPWVTGDEFVQLSEEVECRCYKEDGWTDKFGQVQDGDPDCSDCEGYGLYEKWID